MGRKIEIDHRARVEKLRAIERGGGRRADEPTIIMSEARQTAFAKALALHPFDDGAVERTCAELLQEEFDNLVGAFRESETG